MEELNESRIWQRVRGTDQTEDLRGLLVRQARLRAVYRQLSRRGGKWRLLLEQKESQIACLRGLLRIRTGQGAACPRVGETSQDLAACFDEERGLLSELTRLSREEELGPVFAVLLREQQKHCRLLLELLGTM